MSCQRFKSPHLETSIVNLLSFSKIDHDSIILGLVLLPHKYILNELVSWDLNQT